MQVVRALTQEREKTMVRKFREAASAIALDQHLGKEKILQIYLMPLILDNTAPFPSVDFNRQPGIITESMPSI